MLRTVSSAMLLGAIAFIASSGTLLAGTSVVTPEPSFVALTAVGVGAVILLARRKRGR